MSSTAEVTVQTLAAEAASYFKVGERTGEDDQPIRVLKDDRPEWVYDLVHDAHGGDFLPDDWRYNCCEDALLFIADSDDPEDGSGEFADGAVDVYNGARLAWLSSNLQRPGYVDDAIAEFGDAGSDLLQTIGMGQYLEASEVYGLVLQSLSDRLETVDDARERLEEIRAEIKAERISYGEIAELQGLAQFIDPSDIELLQWAGVEEEVQP